MGFGEGSVSGCAFTGPWIRLVEYSHVIGVERSIDDVAFMFARSFPAMGNQNATDVGCRRELDVVAGLQNVIAIEFGEDALEGHGDGLFTGSLKGFAKGMEEGFGSGHGGAGEGKIINLTTHEDDGTLKSGNVDVLFMGGAAETELLDEDPSDVVFPELTSFRMTLQGAEDRKDLATGEVFAKALVEPFGDGIVKAKEGRHSGARGVSEGINNIATKDDEVLGGSEGEEDA